MIAKAVAWILDYVYAVRIQLGIVTRRRRVPRPRGDLGPVLLIPGVYEPWQFLRGVGGMLARAGHPVHVVEPLGYNLDDVPTAAAVAQGYLDEHDLRDVVVVAHSKGGLIGKYLMVDGASAARIRGMVAVAAPFSGSLYARYLFVPSLRIFSPKNALVLALAREQTVNSRIVSIFGRFDPHIPGGSELVGAKNVRLETGGHFRVLAHPRVMAEVALLSEPQPDGRR